MQLLEPQHHPGACGSLDIPNEQESKMARILFTCAYDGTPWRGWQSQACGMAIQDEIERAFCSILKEPLRIAASGRTDSGVHAHAQCFHADVPDTCRMSVQNWVAALNAHLPGSIRILAAEPVSGDFHARFNASGKVYEYLICTAAVLSPFLQNRCWHCPGGVSVEPLRAALAVYEGSHDFRRFAAKRGNEPEVPPADFYVRTIYSATVQEGQEGDMLRLRFYGNGFMYRMVRMLVGTAHRVAMGKMSLPQLAAMLDCCEGEKTRFCAPAEGLYLKRVLY